MTVPNRYCCDGMPTCSHDARFLLRTTAGTVTWAFCETCAPTVATATLLGDDPEAYAALWLLLGHWVTDPADDDLGFYNLSREQFRSAIRFTPDRLRLWAVWKARNKVRCRLATDERLLDIDDTDPLDPPPVEPILLPVPLKQTALFGRISA